MSDIAALLQRIDGYLGLWFYRHEQLRRGDPLRAEVDLDMTLLRRINNDRENVPVVLPAEVARLLTPEVVAALPALLRVASLANVSVPRWALLFAARREVPPAAWEALGEALEANT